MGLRPLASLSLSLSLPYFAVLLIMVLMLFIGPVLPEYVGTIIALLLGGFALFFLPLSPCPAVLCVLVPLRLCVDPSSPCLLSPSLLVLPFLAFIR